MFSDSLLDKSEDPDDLLIFSDGSSGSSIADNSTHSSAACALRFKSIPKLQPLKIVALTQSIRSHDAELIAVIIGLAAVSVLAKESVLAFRARRILLVSDCTHVVRLINLHSTNLNYPKRKPSFIERMLKEIYFTEFYNGVNLRAQHVRGHSGHVGNEACHRACAWVNAQSDKLLASFGEGALGMLSKHNSGQAWHLIDLKGVDLTEDEFHCRHGGSSPKAQNELLHKALDGLYSKLLPIVKQWLMKQSVIDVS